MDVGVLHRVPQQHEFALSEREWQVMLLIACGFTIGAIARRLYISVKTASTYRARVLEKTQLNNNVEVALQAHVQGLIKFENKRVVVCCQGAIEPIERKIRPVKRAKRADIPVAEELRR